MKMKCAALTIAVALAVGYATHRRCAEEGSTGSCFPEERRPRDRCRSSRVGWPDTSAALRALGYEEGRNVVLEARFADGKVDRLPALAAELVRLRVDLIFTRGSPATRAAKAATATIPILFSIGADPVENGLVASWARPGGNLTGFATADDLDVKRLEYLKRAVPRRRADRRHQDLQETQLEAVRDAARVLGVQVEWLEARGPGDFASAFAAASSGRAEALLVEDSQWVTSYLPRSRSSRPSTSSRPSPGFQTS